MTPKELVQAYYDALIDPLRIKEYVHPDLFIQWDSAKGYVEIDNNEIIMFAINLQRTYYALRLEISHIIAEGNQVSVRYTNHVKTHENPYEEKILSHSIAIWEIKDNKLYRGYVMSHLG